MIVSTEVGGILLYFRGKKEELEVFKEMFRSFFETEVIKKREILEFCMVESLTIYLKYETVVKKISRGARLTLTPIITGAGYPTNGCRALLDWDMKSENYHFLRDCVLVILYSLYCSSM